MNVSVFDLFKIGIGPSSSHTVGPMIAACRFASHIDDANLPGFVRRVRVELFGSLGATGKGYGTDKAVLLGLEGNLPDLIDPDAIEPRLREIRDARRLMLLGKHPVGFDEREHRGFYRKLMPGAPGSGVAHPNGMRFQAFDENGQLLVEKECYSIGGGFVINRDGDRVNGTHASAQPPYPFRTGADLLRVCGETGLSIAAVTLHNECATRPEHEVRAGLLAIWRTMAARLAMKGDGKHVVSLDSVIRTMRETGADMKTKYKETSRGGLSVNVIEC